ncbi:MAG TPA: hypothetical protein VFL13_11960 [Candidatus Baltobacteraceae bacterium]|nr:hypothetical protein [Candidatus Baltobacteraceae bacterium]
MAIILFLSGWAILQLAPDLLLPFHPYGVLGFSTDTYGTVSAVDKAAASRGLHVGDRLDLKRASLRLAEAGFGQLIVLYPPGTNETVPLTSGKTLTLQSHVLPRTLPNDVTNEIDVLAAMAFVVIASLLVLVRPGPVTWAFYFFSYPFFQPGTIFGEYASGGVLAFGSILNDIVGVAGPFALFSFALRFPDKELSRAAGVAERALMCLLGVFIVMNVAIIAVFLTARGNTPRAVVDIQYYISVALYLAGFGMLAVRYFTESRDSRNRLRWVVLSFLVAFMPNLIFGYAGQFLGLYLPIWVVNLTASLTVIAPVGLAYTILKHRLFDVRFVVSRAFVYAVLTSLSVGVLALLDWGFGKWLEDSKFALFVELALALVIGIVMTSLHKRIEHFLNAVVFRAQALALEGLRRFTNELDLISDPHRLLVQTHESLANRLDVEYVAIYTAEGASFAQTSPPDDRAPALLAGDDFAVLRLRRWHEPFECDEAKHPLRSALLLPMSAHTELVGFIVCGPKNEHARYAPDEVATLAALAHRAGTAYVWLTRLQFAPAPTAASVTQA